MIVLEGLTPLQVELANRLWALQDTVDVDSYITMLPRKLRREAQVVRDMMVAAVLDEDCGDLDLAKSVIDSVK